jgi:hypothetical protein
VVANGHETDDHITMHRPALNQSISPRRLDAIMLAAGSVLSTVVVIAAASMAADAGESLTRNTVRVALGWYFAALVLMMWMDHGDWTAATPIGRLARWCWTWGLAWFLVHVGFAFHVYHRWSHADAFEHTRQISGVGEGLYVSYVFGLVWTADVAAWWLAPAWYAARSRWIDCAQHIFMLFMVFNGTVVFESGPIRVAGIVMFVALALAWLTSNRRAISKDLRCDGE